MLCSLETQYPIFILSKVIGGDKNSWMILQYDPRIISTCDFENKYLII